MYRPPFFKNNIYIYLLLAVRGLCRCLRPFSGRSGWAALQLRRARRLLIEVTSLVAEHKLQSVLPSCDPRA